MKRLTAIAALAALVFLVSLLPASAVTSSNLKLYDYTSAGGYFIAFQVRLTAADANPSGESYTIPNEVWKTVRSGFYYEVGITDSAADAAIGITITDSEGFEIYDEEHSHTAAEKKSADYTLGFFPAVTGASAPTIAFDTDWTTQSSGFSDYVTITITFGTDKSSRR